MTGALLGEESTGYVRKRRPEAAWAYRLREALQGLLPKDSLTGFAGRGRSEASCSLYMEGGVAGTPTERCTNFVFL